MEWIEKKETPYCEYRTLYLCYGDNSVNLINIGGNGIATYMIHPKDLPWKPFDIYNINKVKRLCEEGYIKYMRDLKIDLINNITIKPNP